jgi:hypothetical protein
VRLHNRILLAAGLLLSSLYAAATAHIDNVFPGSGPVGTQVQINGSGFGATQTGNTAAFNSVSAAIVTWSDTQIVATVPTTAITGPVKVTVGGVGSNADVYFTVPTPRITGLSPTSGVVGTQVTISGSGFQTAMGSSAIRFNGFWATVVSWSDTQIVAKVPDRTSTGPVTAVVNGNGSNSDQVFTMPNPTVTGLAPGVATCGSQVTVTGYGFGPSQGSSTVTLGGASATIVTWSDTQIVATVPYTAISGVAKVSVGGVDSNTNVFITVPAPHIDTLTPSSGVVGTEFTISGSGFQPTQRSSWVRFPGGFYSTVRTWSDTQITAVVPVGPSTGAVQVIVNNVYSNGDKVFTLPNPIIATLSPPVGPRGSQVTMASVLARLPQHGQFVSQGLGT